MPVTAALNSRHADAHAAYLRGAGGGRADSHREVGIVVHVPDVDNEADGGAGAGAMPATTMPSHEGHEGAPPSEGDAPSASTRMYFAGGMHLHINTQTEQVSRAS